MKKLSLFCTATVAIVMMMFTSCLGDDGPTTRYTYGVVKPLGTGYTYVLKIDDYDLPIYSSSLFTEVMNTPTFVYAYIEYDTKSEINADAKDKGYYTGGITILSTIDHSTAQNITRYPYQAEFDKALDKEISLYGMSYEYTVDNSFILGIAYEKMTEDQQCSYLMYYDNEPTDTYDSVNLYNLYVRVIKYSDSGSEKTNQLIPHAFQLQGLVDHANALEAEKGKDKYYINVKFVTDIDEEDEIEWTSLFSTPMPIAVSKEN